MWVKETGFSKWRAFERLRILTEFWFRLEERWTERKGASFSHLMLVQRDITEPLYAALPLWHTGQERQRKRALKRLHICISRHLDAGNEDRRVMQILICLTGKLVKFPCFSAINPQITYAFPFVLAPSLSIRTFYVQISTRSFRELLSLCGINDVPRRGKGKKPLK